MTDKLCFVCRECYDRLGMICNGVILFAAVERHKMHILQCAKLVQQLSHKLVGVGSPLLYLGAGVTTGQTAERQLCGEVLALGPL